MKSIAIPLEFLKAIGEKPPIFRILWIKWLSEHNHELFRSDFNEHFYSLFKEKNLNLETIKEAYELGIVFFEGGFTFIDGKKEKKQYKEEVLSIVDKVIDYLNEKALTTYTPSKANIECIASRIKEGYSISDFKIVIDKKVMQWKGTSQEKYLRPITLFQAKKFENYLNEPEFKENGKPTTKVSNIGKLTNAAQRAKELFN
jgi:uncharacterized phage protein (TIGR02220 family)